MLISSKSIEALARRIQSEDEVFCAGLFLSARWFVTSEIGKQGVQLVILPDKDSAEYCSSDLYNLTDGDKVFFLPSAGKNIEKSTYKSSISVQRTSAIENIVKASKSGANIFIVSYPEAIEESIPSTEKIAAPILSVKVGNQISHDRIEKTLFENGFEHVDFVSQPGQFTLRGGVVDIFSYSLENPYRLSLFGDEVDEIHIFDCNTQLSKEKVENADIYSDLSQVDEVGEQSLFDILPKSSLLWLDSSDMYHEKEFFKRVGDFKRIYLEVPLQRQDVPFVKFYISPQPTFNKNFELLTADIRSRLESGYRVIIFGEKRKQLDRLESIISQNEGLLPEFAAGKNIHAGFVDAENKVCCYSDHEIFDRFHRVNIRRTVEKSEQLTINELSSFEIGDYVVHIDYGVGTFGGLVRMKDDKGRVHEVVKLVYKDGDVVFISVHSLHKISRFKSKDSEPPRINKLGTKTWENIKTGAKSKVKDIAKDLIKLYARRKGSEGFAYSPDSYLQEELESSFIYEDTPDQEKATDAVKKDMEDSCPMDRLICGDVGFGKTEIAIRAAFKAVTDGKQVAVLVPTTILSLQHYNTFKDRLKDFPCTVDHVSRLRTAKEISDIKQSLKAGKIDILIGTHKILGEGFEFKDLGLLVIDEEQKFGVGAKEKLRQLKESVDTLTLTATPIPRTLQFSLLGARDLSIINTPPPNRIPVQTEIMTFDKDEIRSIINYELKRGGQIFFVHNRVEELDGIAAILHGLVPNMKICVAHGQMQAKVLEDKIISFMNGDFDLLLCTTIVENGLDIPNANTIIINQAQNIGLSDLHQLRGRVGRSNTKAFCYLIVPPLVSVTDDARRRLKAIEAFSELGSGFNIAMQDLDIRGAGNLLGAEQSGFISDMGFETYQKILSEAMEELGVETGITTGASIEDGYISDTTIETDQVALIPDDYMGVTAEKIRIYKELDSIEDFKTLKQMKERLEDRFGKMPAETERLFDIVKIRQIARKAGFEKVIIKNGIMIMFFISNQMSPYYKSGRFQKVLERVNENGRLFELKQSEGKIKLISRNVDSISKALTLISKL